MIDYFLGEVDVLLAQADAAFQRGDFAEVGRLGHRMKGNLVYLGAAAAEEAARCVEDLRHKSALAGAERAVQGLRQQCEVLKPVLIDYRARTTS